MCQFWSVQLGNIRSKSCIECKAGKDDSGKILLGALRRAKAALGKAGVAKCVPVVSGNAR